MAIRFLAICGLATLGVAAIGCQTVPDEAPVAFHEADKEVKAAERADVDDLLPGPMELAHQKLDQALELFDDSEDLVDDNNMNEAESVRGQAESLASEAGQIASTALRIQNDVNGWSENLGAYDELQSKAGGQSDLQKEVANLKGQNDQLMSQVAVLQGQQAQGQLPDGFEVNKPVAFFDTGKADLDANDRDDIQEIAQMLKSNDGLYITLNGFADARGPTELNQKLSSNRAASVASELKNLGVDENRIAMQGMGEVEDNAKGTSAGRLQLDRRVVAIINTVAH